MHELSADHYDLLFAHKDYQREAHHLRDRLWRVNPGMHSVLDVACGTGAHDEVLCQFYEVDGLDVHPGFLELARKRNPGGTYHETDMCNFRLDRMYDVILCLGSIGYAQSYGHLVAVLRCCSEHLLNGGVLVVEPWLEPSQWPNDTVAQLHNERDGMHITRLAHHHRVGSIAAIDFHYLIGSPKTEIIHRTERHELGLFTRDDTRQALVEVGLTGVEYDPQGMAHGLFSARKEQVG